MSELLILQKILKPLEQKESQASNILEELVSNYSLHVPTAQLSFTKPSIMYIKWQPDHPCNL